MTAASGRRGVEILLVEDSPTDRLIAVEALQQASIINTLHVVENGVEAMAYLRRQGKHATARRPDLILLDLNLPKKDGRSVLVEIKSDPLLKLIPVIVLTTSSADEDVARAYSDHANSYITKPVDFPRFIRALDAIGTYWFEVVTLPPELAVQRMVQNERPTSLDQRQLDAERMEAIGQLSSGVAHDFNNLLTVLQGHAELLEEVDGDARVQESVRGIKDACERAAHLTRQLLTFSQRQPTRLEPVALIGW